MKEVNKNILTISIITILTILTIILLPLIPGYLEEPTPDKMVGFQPVFILVFLLFNLIFIGIPAWFHYVYVKDYSTIKNIWFFALFGGITGAMLGEGGNVVMIIPYTILMLIYAFFYKKFTWWKVALTTYFAGMVVENVINRSPIQIPTLMWIAFFTYPYFWTKIVENRKKLSFQTIWNDFKWVFLSSGILSSLAVFVSKDNISPPLIILGAALPFIIIIIYRLIRKD